MCTNILCVHLLISRCFSGCKAIQALHETSHIFTKYTRYTAVSFWRGEAPCPCNQTNTSAELLYLMMAHTFSLHREELCELTPLRSMKSFACRIRSGPSTPLAEPSYAELHLSNPIGLEECNCVGTALLSVAKMHVCSPHGVLRIHAVATTLDVDKHRGRGLVLTRAKGLPPSPLFALHVCRHLFGETHLQGKQKAELFVGRGVGMPFY